MGPIQRSWAEVDEGSDELESQGITSLTSLFRKGMILVVFAGLMFCYVSKGFAEMVLLAAMGARGLAIRAEHTERGGGD